MGRFITIAGTRRRRRRRGPAPQEGDAEAEEAQQRPRPPRRSGSRLKELGRDRKAANASPADWAPDHPFD